MKDLKKYIETNKDRFLEELFSLIRIPSISSQEEHKGDMVRCAERWRELILAAGADRCEVMPTAGNPVVYGEKIMLFFFWYPYNLNIGAFDIVPEVSETVLSSFHSFYFILLFKSYFHHFIFQLTDSFFCFRYAALDSF